MRAEARFANPDEQMVTITLRGTLKQFDDLATALLSDGAVPYYRSQALIEVIRDAAWKLRGTVSAERDSGSGPEGENSRSEVEGEAPQSGLSASEGIAQPPSAQPSEGPNQ